MNFPLLSLSLLVTFTLTSSFHLLPRVINRFSLKSSPDPALTQEIYYKNLAISGFISKHADFAETYPFTKLFASGKWTAAGAITAVTDDLQFAKKRMVNPSNVYSGLIDVLEFAVSDRSPTSMEDVLKDKEAWLAFNVSSSDLPKYCDTAAKVGLKRVVFGVKMNPDESGTGVEFEDSCKILAQAGIMYTIVKFGDVRRMGEAKFPYRVVRGAMPLPVGEILSSEDLMRVLIECVDLPKTFSNVYGIGPGSAVDSEILVYMKGNIPMLPDMVSLIRLFCNFDFFFA